MGPLGPQWHRQEPLGSCYLARRLLEVAGVKWWDGYSGQETVVLDDFKDYAMPLVELQRLLDWYPLWVEVKGGSVPMLAKRYVLTANTSPEDWYLKADVHRTIWRRVTDFAAKHGRLINCVDGWTPPTPGAAGAEVPGNTEPQGQEPQPALGEDIVKRLPIGAATK